MSASNSETENDCEIQTTKRQKIEEAQSEKRSRKKPNWFGTKEFDSNDDDFFENITNENSAFIQDETTNSNNENVLVTETVKSSNTVIEYSPGEREIMKHLAVLTKDLKVVQRIVAELRVEHTVVAECATAARLQDVDKSLLDELGLPLNTLEHLRKFEENLFKRDFQRKVVRFKSFFFTAYN